MTGALVVTAAGLSSTLQDAGRTGYLRYGVSMTGAFDPFLHCVANRLVENDPHEAAVEVTLKGDEYLVEAPECRVALAGDFALAIDGQPAEPWHCHTLHQGQRFTIGAARRGLRGYLAVAGGFELKPVLGSLSVHTRTGIGPIDGRALKVGDRLPLRQASSGGRAYRFDLELPPPRTSLRVVLGPQDHYFDPDSVALFLASEFEVTPKCDRMGYQLSGPAIEYRKDIPLISEGIALGSLQVLGRGVTVITLVDRQTTGGYPKIATVITPDIRELAHTPPGARLRFVPVEIEEAQAIRRASDAELKRQLQFNLTEIRSGPPTAEALLANNLISGAVDGLDR